MCIVDSKRISKLTRVAVLVLVKMTLQFYFFFRSIAPMLFNPIPFAYDYDQGI